MTEKQRGILTEAAPEMWEALEWMYADVTRGGKHGPEEVDKVPDVDTLEAMYHLVRRTRNHMLDANGPSDETQEYTIVGVYPMEGETITDTIEATSAAEALQIFARDRSEGCDIVEIFEGQCRSLQSECPSPLRQGYAASIADILGDEGDECEEDE